MADEFEPFRLNGLASLWVVLGCEFAPLTRGRLWVSPELPNLIPSDAELNYLFGRADIYSMAGPETKCRRRQIGICRNQDEDGMMALERYAAERAVFGQLLRWHLVPKITHNT